MALVSSTFAYFIAGPPPKESQSEIRYAIFGLMLIVSISDLIASYRPTQSLFYCVGRPKGAVTASPSFRSGDAS
jgi:hypothetical protein